MYSIDICFIMILYYWELHNLTVRRFPSRMSPSHADGMCGFAAIQIDGHSLVCN